MQNWKRTLNDQKYVGTEKKTHTAFYILENSFENIRNDFKFLFLFFTQIKLQE